MTRDFIKEKCDKKGNIRQGNVTTEEQAGLRSIKKKVKDQEWIVMPSDKSGRLTANTKDNYMEKIQPHKGEDATVSMEEVKKLESEMNGTTLQWGRILALGDRWDTAGRHWGRVKAALKTRECMIPPLYGLPKDHKPTSQGEEHLGPPLRPVCGATESINGALSELLTEILTTLGDRADTNKFVSRSTEEVMEALTRLNLKKMEDPLIFSLDVEGMYPNLNRAEVAKVVARQFMKSDLEVEVDGRELGLYLAICYQAKREELYELGLGEVGQRRRCPQGKTILMTTAEVLTRNEATVSKFQDQGRPPTPGEKKLMFSLALAEGVKTCMDHHLYSLNKETLLQDEGAPIGLRLAGAAAKVFMVDWCERFKEKLAVATRFIPSFQLHLLKFYVDDELEVTECLPLGSRLVEGDIRVVEEEKETDREVPGDQRTATLIVEIANSVCPYTKLTVDYPSAHQTMWMPLLDIQVRVAEDKTIDWKFYRKPLSIPYFILNRSAVSSKEKRTCLVQECLRRLRKHTASQDGDLQGGSTRGHGRNDDEVRVPRGVQGRGAGVCPGRLQEASEGQ